MVTNSTPAGSRQHTQVKTPGMCHLRGNKLQ
jgi:hypothetical protein